MSIHEKNTNAGGSPDPRLTALDTLRHTERRVALARLSSYIAHELGTPLNVIHARALMITSGDVTGEAIQRNAQIIAEQAARMTKMIREMLAITRGGEIARAPVDLLEVAALARSLVSLSSEPSGVHVELDSSSEPTVVHGDPDLLLELAMNLLANGVQATPEGGTVTVTVCPSRRSKADDPKGPPVDLGSIAIRDEGAGIPKDLFEQIWKPFFTTRPRSRGDSAGLGLNIAQTIAREHGGFIELDSSPGVGSCFTVFLPRGDI